MIGDAMQCKMWCAGCTSCPAGTFGSTTGLTSASCSGSCPAGQYSLGAATSCTSCAAGLYGSSGGATSAACSGTCGAGQYSTAGSTGGARDDLCGTRNQESLASIRCVVSRLGQVVLHAPRARTEQRLEYLRRVVAAVRRASTRWLVRPRAQHVPRDSTVRRRERLLRHALARARLGSTRRQARQVGDKWVRNFFIFCRWWSLHWCRLCMCYFHSWSACASCPAGTFGSTTGLTSASCNGSCPAGQYSLAGATSCTSCAAGLYGSSGGATSAACSGTCGAGQYSTAGSTGEPQGRGKGRDISRATDFEAHVVCNGGWWVVLVLQDARRVWLVPSAQSPD